MCSSVVSPRELFSAPIPHHAAPTRGAPRAGGPGPAARGRRPAGPNESESMSQEEAAPARRAKSKSRSRALSRENEWRNTVTVTSPKELMLILYGSETGTAEDIAFQFFDRCMAAGVMPSSISSMDDYYINSLPDEKEVFFILSTTGDGDIPSNAKFFWKFILQKSLSPTSLSSVKVSVFGLGDSSYSKYNAAARRLSKRLEQLGATVMFPPAYGDDQAKYSYLSVLDKWMNGVLEELLRQRNATLTVSSDAPSRSLWKPCGFEVTSIVKADQVPALSSSGVIQHYCLRKPIDCRDKAVTEPFIARVVENTQLTRPGWKQVVTHLALTVSNSNYNVDSDLSSLYTAGDIVTIHPHNPIELVTRMVAVLRPAAGTRIAGADVSKSGSVSADTLISIKRKVSPLNPPRRSRIAGDLVCRLGDLFECVLDIGGIPRRPFFSSLAAFASDDEQKEKLLELSSGAGTDLYYEYCVKERRSYVEVLEDFRSSRPSLEELLDLIPVLEPRHYSIASSPIAHRNQIHLCVAVASRVTPYGRTSVGICSGYLQRLAVGDELSLWIRKGLFSSVCASTDILKSPLILVGPGTGVAPMRALIYDRKARICDTNNTLLPAPITLFFGCRRRDSDYLYREEWEGLSGLSLSPSSYVSLPPLPPSSFNTAAAENTGYDSTHVNSESNTGATTHDYDGNTSSYPALTVVTAFSQEQLQKEYVTHKIRALGDSICRKLAAGAIVLISGSAKRMPADVRRAIVDAVRESGQATGLISLNGSEQEAEIFVRHLERRGRILVEAW